MSLPAGQKLFFVALLPPSAIQDEVTQFKQTAQKRFGSGHALKSPPHITLVPPFRSEHTDFSTLTIFCNQQQHFTVRLQHFNHFGSRVIFVDVPPEPPLLTCQQQLADFCHGQFGVKPDSRPFHPHMTVAFKDLQRAIFPEAWAYFSAQTFERTFTADALTLLRHTGQEWVVEQTFTLSEQPAK